MSRQFNYEKASSVLAASSFNPEGDEQLCQEWGVSRKTLWVWRKKFLQDAFLRHKVSQKKALIEGDWQCEARQFLRKSIAKLEQLVEKADKTEDIHSVAGAIKVIGELTIAQGALEDEPTDNYSVSKIEEQN